MGGGWGSDAEEGNANECVRCTDEALSDVTAAVDAAFGGSLAALFAEADAFVFFSFATGLALPAAAASAFCRLNSSSCERLTTSTCKLVKRFPRNATLTLRGDAGTPAPEVRCRWWKDIKPSENLIFEHRRHRSESAPWMMEHVMQKLFIFRAQTRIPCFAPLIAARPCSWEAWYQPTPPCSPLASVGLRTLRRVNATAKLHVSVCERAEDCAPLPAPPSLRT